MPNKKRIWDNAEDVVEVRKSDNLKFVFSATTRTGYRCVTIREWYRRKKDSTWHPGRDHVMFMLKSPLKDGSGIILEPAEEIFKALEATIKVAAEMELFDEEKAVYVDKE